MREDLTRVMSPSKGDGQQGNESTNAPRVGQMGVLEAETTLF
jgi:hypothetical protein